MATKDDLKASDVIKVKNVSEATVYTSQETIEKGKTGKATFAEVQISQGRLEKV